MMHLKTNAHNIIVFVVHIYFDCAFFVDLEPKSQSKREKLKVNVKETPSVRKILSHRPHSLKYQKLFKKSKLRPDIIQNLLTHQNSRTACIKTSFSCYFRK